ncbi:MAG: bifunctional UDP-N-acetylmuramoyl-tripeptide:D-alanyl-D-alanine ligase/alanine racemase [Bacteroidetes bacterium]|nr:bifunctional UDP-N-acetylmuramoyl-tripeptide:D-alanyl-D-alanine ligase/alanine racemase [Bacteroidota bacterium]
MQQYSFHIIGDIVNGSILKDAVSDAPIEHLSTDSRKILHPATTLFFALKTPQGNGHSFIKNCYDKGVRYFIIKEKINTELYPDAGFILVENTLKALQQLAAHHRSTLNPQPSTSNLQTTTYNFQPPTVIAITGSNGKTMVKEWLYQLLHADYQIVRSPKSYNSQIGVPLSVWQMNATHNLAIFEAGISQKGEMEILSDIIQPTIGVFTFLGEAHQEGFHDLEEKFIEKSKLFQSASTIIYPSAHTGGYHFSGANKKLISWGKTENDELQVLHERRERDHTQLQLKWNANSFELDFPFTDKASIHNLLTCSCVCLHLGMSTELLAARIKNLEPVSLRLEIKKGIQGCTILNDAYTADISSLEIGLHLLLQQSQQRRTVILSDFIIPDHQKQSSYGVIADMLIKSGIQKVITIGEDTRHYLRPALPEIIHPYHFDNTEHLIQHLPQLHFFNEAILIKGARKFELENLMPLLEMQVHETMLEINLSAISRNLAHIRSRLNPDTKIMAVVKAFSYGSGSYEVARLLQYHRVDYLAVAFADEGITLRKAGIDLPIMVMNADRYSFDALTAYQLEPEIFSFEMLKQFSKHLEKEGLNAYPVHIKIDTGMHRLGFMNSEWDTLAKALSDSNLFSVRSLMSHLVASEDEHSDAFSLEQARLFESACNKIRKAIGYDFVRHLNNTSGILRHPSLQYEMVRLGIGLYGVEKDSPLEQAIRFKTSIAQIKSLEAGETVGYNRKGVLTRPSRIATVRVGYADGFPRNLSNGKGFMILHGQKAPVMGNVCMDMTMLDVTDIIEAKEGDEVEIFGVHQSVTKLALQADTIAYEILTGISQRVKRVYFEE